MKSFEKWETEEVELTFGIEQVKKMPIMDEWLEFEQPLNQTEEQISEKLRLFLADFADFWNEEDMKAFFILPIIQMVDFYAPKKYRTFMEATMQAELLDVKNNPCVLRGRVEMVVATGKQKPQKPFFFLNEYKPQIKVVSDPKGQLLSAMLVAQTKNNDSFMPIYGLYNIGQNWFFLLLNGKKYTVSAQLDATKQNDLKKIINMLQYVKKHIEKNV